MEFVISKRDQYQLILFMSWNNIFQDYASIIAPRDMILDLYTWMTTGNDSKYIHLQSMVIKGHKRSLEITRGKKLETSQKDHIFCMHAHIFIRNYI